MNTLMIDRVSLTYKNGVQAIKDISLHIGQGMFGLLGPNAAGKSSIMKTLAGLQRPTAGSIKLNEVDIVQNPEYVKQRLGFLPQDFGVYPKVTAYDLLNHIALLKGISDKSERKQQISGLLSKVNLYEAANKEVNTFSGGMRQRFGVAQALLGNPQLIVIDEPTAGLDPEERNRFNSLLSEISTEVIVILSTHLVEDVRNLCAEMAIIRQGRLIKQGRPMALVEELKGKIWSRPIHRHELEAWQSAYNVISRQLIERALHITIYADDRPEGFEPVTPVLEHVYFHTLTQTDTP